MNNSLSVIINTCYKIEHYNKSGIEGGRGEFKKLTDELYDEHVDYTGLYTEKHGHIITVQEPHFMKKECDLWDIKVHKLLSITEGDLFKIINTIGDADFISWFTPQDFIIMIEYCGPELREVLAFNRNMSLDKYKFILKRIYRIIREHDAFANVDDREP